MKLLNNSELEEAYKNRKIINKQNLERLSKNNIDIDDCTIISSNCIGGMIYHDLGLKFKSPTINLYFTCHDFALFINNLKYYLSLTPVEFSCDDFPILKLGDIKLFCQHYKNSNEAIDAWERRKERIDLNNIYVIATDRDCSDYNDLKLIDQAPYRKTIFVSNPNLQLDNSIYVVGYDKQVGHLDKFVNESGYREYEQYLSIDKIFKK